MKFLYHLVVYRTDHHGKKVFLVRILRGPFGLTRPDFDGGSGERERDREQTTSPGFAPSGLLRKNDSVRPSVLRPGGRLRHPRCYKLCHQKSRYTLLCIKRNSHCMSYTVLHNKDYPLRNTAQTLSFRICISFAFTI